MHLPTPRRDLIDPRSFGRLCGHPLWVALVASVVLAGCAANEASGPMKPTQATASKPMTPAATTKPSTPVKPASNASTAPKPALPADARSAAASSTPAPATPKAVPAPAAKPVAPAVAQAASPSTPTQTAAQPKADDPHTTPAAPAASTADFSTGLLYPDPDPATAATRTVSLCDFKNGEWTPIMTAPVQTYGGDARGVTFRGVPVGRMVLPAYIFGDEVLPAANPWAVETSGKVREVKGPCATCPSNEPPILTLELRPAPADAANQRMTIEPGDYGLMAVRAERNRRYTLSYWDGAWKPIGEATVSGDKPVRIEGVPSKRVLWLESEGESLTLPVVP